MFSPRILLFSTLLVLGSISTNSLAQTFVVGDRAATVTNANIKDDTASAGDALAAGENISFQGDVNVPGGVGVQIDPILNGLTFSVGSGATISAQGIGFAVGVIPVPFPSPIFDGVFSNLGEITSSGSFGVFFGSEFTGSFSNSGTITAGSNGPPTAGILFFDDMTGQFVNTGTIQGLNGSDGVGFANNIGAGGVFINSGTIFGTLDGVFIQNDLAGTAQNAGTISGQFDGFYINDDLEGSFENTGTIIGRNQDGFDVNDDLNGSFKNSGLIQGDVDGVYVNFDLNGSFENTGTIIGENQDGVDIDRHFTGTFVNRGTIIGRGASHEGFEVDGEFSGTATNYGTIQGADDAVDIGDVLAGGLFINRGTLVGADDAFDVDGDFAGRVENYSTMQGAAAGFDVDGTFSGEFFNCGIIEAGTEGFSIATGTGTIRNHGGRIQGAASAITFGAGDGRVVLSGPSHIVGSIDGGVGGGDVLRFQDMRGVSAAKEAELIALAASDPNAGTVTLFGETISWLNIEDIQVDASTLESYESLFAGAGLGAYGAGLDQITGLDDALRNFLKGLNDVSDSNLTGVVNNTSGRTVRNSMADLRRERDTNFFHLFSNQFSSLRGDVAGGGGQGLAVRSGGFLSREVEVGAEVNLPDPEVDTWVTSYVGSGNQDSNGVRAAADYDQTSILFGRGREWNENTWLGWFGGYSRSEGQVDSFGSYLENDGGWFGLNAQLRRGDAFAVLVGGIGFQDIESNRRDFQGNVHEGDTEAFSGFFYGQFGRDILFGEKGKWTPYAGFTFGGDSINAYSENGSSGSNLRFQDGSESVFQTVLGMSVSGMNETNKGWIRPRADLAWWHSYGDDSFETGFVNSNFPGNFNVVNPGANENRGVVQLGIEFGLDSFEDWIFEAGYFGLVGEDDYSSHGGTIGARVEF